MYVLVAGPPQVNRMFSVRFLKVVPAKFLLVSLKEGTCETKKNVFFYLISKVYFVLEIIKFWLLKCGDVIKCLSMKHETHFTEWLGK